MSRETAFVILDIFNFAVLGYFILLNGIYLVTSMFAFVALRRRARHALAFVTEDLLAAAGAPPITLIAPAYNEEATCVESVKSLLTLNYPEFEVLVVNDGSRDGTVAVLRQSFDLRAAARAPLADIASRPIRAIYRSRTHPNLWVVDKENGGKADALNAGLALCRTPLFCAMDADTLVERDALSRVARAFVEDGRVIAAGGTIRIVNNCTVRSGVVTEVRLPRNLLAKFQVMEYLRAFLSGRMGWDAINATLIISGAFGLFRREAAVAIGGYATDTVGEDMELVVRLHRDFREKGTDYFIRYLPDPVAWTECPESMSVLGRQRDRWQRGLMETLSRHRMMMFNPKYGVIGMAAFPYFYFLEMLGPVVEFCGYIVFVVSVLVGYADALYVAAFLTIAFVFGVTLSVAAVGLEEISLRRYPRAKDLAVLLALAVVENFGYRQLSTWWRLRGTFSSLRRVKGWGKMERRGFLRT